MPHRKPDPRSKEELMDDLLNAAQSVGGKVLGPDYHKPTREEKIELMKKAGPPHLRGRLSHDATSSNSTENRRNHSKGHGKTER